MTLEQKRYPGTPPEAGITTNVPPPAEVVAAALAEIQPDGRVLEYDDETEEWTTIEPAAPKPLEHLPADQYYDELFNLRRTIADTIMGIADEPEQSTRRLMQLARRLTAYRHDPAFIDYATSLLTLDEHGYLHRRDFVMHPTI